MIYIQDGLRWKANGISAGILARVLRSSPHGLSMRLGWVSHSVVVLE